MNQTIKVKQSKCSICLETEIDQIISCPHCPLQFCQNCLRQALLSLDDPEISFCTCRTAYSLYEVLDRVGDAWFHQTFFKRYKEILITYRESQASVFPSLPISSHLFQLSQRKSVLELEVLDNKISSVMTKYQLSNWKTQRMKFDLELKRKKLMSQRELLTLSDPQQIKNCRARIADIEKEIHQEKLFTSQEYIRRVKEEKQPQIRQLEEIVSSRNRVSSEIFWSFGEGTRITTGPHINDNSESTEEVIDFHDYYHCPRPQCNGLVSIINDNNDNSNHGLCGKCSAPTCSKCHELLDSKEEEGKHNCNPDILKNLKAIESDETTKPCPRCRAPIHKYVGCNDVFCIKCRLKFNFRTGQEIKRAFHNPDYDRFLNERLNQTVEGECQERLERYIQLDYELLSEIIRLFDSFVPEVTEIRDQLLEEIDPPYYHIETYFHYTNNELTRSGYGNKLINRAMKRERDSRVVDYLNTAITVGDYFRLKVLDYLQTELEPHLRVTGHQDRLRLVLKKTLL